jgi:predicted O-methyltransferase YrrM
MIEITTEKLSSLDMNKFNYTDEEFPGESGKEHYRLLSYVSSCFKNSDIFDIGSHRGSSALALSYESSNRVYSFDIERQPKNYDTIPANIEFVICNLFVQDERETWEEKLLNSPLIFLDIDTHDGVLEYEFYMYLVSKEYKGIVIFDDILYFTGMRVFWDKIDPYHQRDVSKYGHWSGTGIVDFSGMVAVNHQFSLPSTVNDKNWTLVTAYFDLTKCSDASEEIKKRDGDYYLQHSKGCLSLEYNMVIFYDPEYEDKLKAIRPEHLHDRTTWIPVSFEDMKMTKYRNKIITNRVEHPYEFDNRNTASYYLLCMSRYDALKRVIELNPHQSTHFAWINICIERMGPSNLEELPNALSLFRDRFSTCYIDYIPPHFTVHHADYFMFGRCSMCSGFFTGRGDYMYEFCNRVEEMFMEYLNSGYGHADEQLFLAVYFRYPWLFEFYYGDYQQMITNYVSSKENTDFTIDLMIRSAYNDSNWYVCYRACQYIWKSDNNPQLVKELLEWYRQSSIEIGKYDEFLRDTQ